MPLASTGLVTTCRFDHPTEVPHQDPPDERSDVFSVNFVENGAFWLRSRGSRDRVDARKVFVTWPDMVFACEHPLEGPPTDICTSIAFEREFAEEVISCHGHRHKLHSTLLPLTNRLAYLRLAVIRNLHDPLLLETIAVEVLKQICRRGGDRSARLFRRGQLEWYARRVDTARERLEARFSEPHSLHTMAREAGMSPYHFARVFSELAGMPPHRYLVTIRLRVAAERLREGASVTAACFDTGFSNLSHFCRSFKRAFGRSPSTFLD